MGYDNKMSNLLIRTAQIPQTNAPAVRVFQYKDTIYTGIFGTGSTCNDISCK